MSMTVEKGSAVGPTESMLARVERRLFLPSGGHVAVRSDDQPKPRPRIQMIPHLADLMRGPHIPMVVTGRKRLIAFCMDCNETQVDLPAHDRATRGHQIRYMLLPDLR
jgi:hypothetical protein